MRSHGSHATQLSQMRAMLDFNAEAAVLVDSDGCVRHGNAAARALSGRPLDGQLSATIFKLPDPAMLSELCAGRRRQILPCRARWAGGEAVVDITLHGRALPDGGAILGFALAPAGPRDTITGLPDRVAFESALQTHLESADAQPAVLCQLHVNSLKALLTVLSPETGAELLRELARTLQSGLGAADLLGRLESDEFGVLLRAEPDAVQGRIDALIDALRQKFFVYDGRSYSLGLSVGVHALRRATPDRAERLSAAQCLARAAAACFEATESGRPRVIYTDRVAPLSDRRRDQLALVGELGRALDASRFSLYYEDVVRAEDFGAVVYRELLLRVPATDGSLQAPFPFIEAAERSELMTLIDRWVVREALSQISRLPDDGIRYAINLSGRSLSDAQFLQFVEHHLHDSGIAAQRLCFEITETSAILRLTDALRCMERLAALGCRFALDDFGTGMASFAYLRDFPVHYVKIDGRFVQHMLTSAIDRSIVESINRISHELGMLSIAEHVDTLPLAQMLRDNGVDLLQGHVLARPQPLTVLS